MPELVHLDRVVRTPRSKSLRRGNKSALAYSSEPAKILLNDLSLDHKRERRSMPLWGDQELHSRLVLLQEIDLVRIPLTNANWAAFYAA
jgi:hypothetical protein